MAVPRSLKNATIVIYDDDATRNSITLDLEDGDWSFDVPNPSEHVLDRGDPGSVIEGTHVDPTGSCTLQVQGFTGNESVPKVLLGTASSWVYSINDLNAAPFAAAASSLQSVASNIKLTHWRVAFADPAGGSTEYLYLPNVETTSFGVSEGMPSKWNISFTVRGMTRGNFLTNLSTS